MVEHDHPRLSISRQCQALGLARSTWYHRPKGEKATNLDLMRLIDVQFLDTPFYGSRQMRQHLKHNGIAVGRGRIRRLMRKMGLMAIYQKPRTSAPHPEHKVYPYLLRGLRVARPDQVWCADITYVPMKRGFLYLVAIMDWHSRAVLSWRLSNTMDTDFCIAALEEAINRYGIPEIFNTDQGSQFTSLEFTQVLKDAGVAISMDGKGRWMDNVFIERLWRSVKWECLYLRELETGSQVRHALVQWFRFYNEERPHTSFDGRRPMDVYRDGQLVSKAA
jgi:putative transposase